MGGLSPTQPESKLPLSDLQECTMRKPTVTALQSALKAGAILIAAVMATAAAAQSSSAPGPVKAIGPSLTNPFLISPVPCIVDPKMPFRRQERACPPPPPATACLAGAQRCFDVAKPGTVVPIAIR